MTFVWGCVNAEEGEGMQEREREREREEDSLSLCSRTRNIPRQAERMNNIDSTVHQRSSKIIYQIHFPKVFLLPPASQQAYCSFTWETRFPAQKQSKQFHKALGTSPSVSRNCIHCNTYIHTYIPPTCSTRDQHL